MWPEEKDRAYLFDMLEAGRQVGDFVTGLSFETYLGNRMARMAVERGLEIVGEAARRVSASFKASHPEVPWRDLIGLRNVLSHDYGEIKQDRLWEIAISQVPELVRVLDTLVSGEPK